MGVHKVAKILYIGVPIVTMVNSPIVTMVNSPIVVLTFVDFEVFGKVKGCMSPMFRCRKSSLNITVNSRSEVRVRGQRPAGRG